MKQHLERYLLGFVSDIISGITNRISGSSLLQKCTLTKDFLGGDKGVENTLSLLYFQPLDTEYYDEKPFDTRNLREVGLFDIYS